MDKRTSGTALAGIISGALATSVGWGFRGDLSLAPATGFGRGQLLFLVILWVAAGKPDSFREKY